VVGVQIVVADADAADVGPVIEALEHRYTGHDAQEQHQPARPAPDAGFALLLVDRLEIAKSA